MSSLKRKQSVRKILVIQMAKIGDMVCSTPVFREIKMKYPKAFLSVMVDPESMPVLNNNPYIDEFIPVSAADLKGFSGKLRTAKSMRQKNIDTSICLQPNTANVIIPLWALIQKRYSVYPHFCGITFKLASGLNTQNLRHTLNKSIVETYIRLLNQTMGIHIRQDSTKMDLYSSNEADIKVDEFLKRMNIHNIRLIGIAPAARNKLKELTPATFSKIADTIQDELNCQVILTGGVGDREIIDAVKSQMKTVPIDSCGEFSLEELSALLKKLSLFISVDSGPVYMAVAAGIPIINIAGPCAMSERPLGDRYTVVQKSLDCVPCSYTFATANKCTRIPPTRDCITDVSADEVIKDAKKLLTWLGS